MVDAELQLGFILIFLAFVDRGDDHDSRPVFRREAADEAGDLESVHLGQQPVEQQDLRVLFLNELDGLEPRSRLNCFTAETLQDVDEHGYPMVWPLLLRSRLTSESGP